VVPELGEAAYHCMTRTVNGERLLNDTAREVLRKQIRLLAEFCGVEIVTYAILANHFHVLVRVPQKTELADPELLRRYRLLYPRPTRYQSMRLQMLESLLEENGPEAIAWRRRISTLMGDISQFMKLLKQRFSIWFNKTHNRFGTLWAERFKSVLVEGAGRVLQTMAAYIDLNCVRAGLAEDPKDYRFCGYAEAVAGVEMARRGLESVCGELKWEETQAAYRKLLFGTGVGPREKGGGISIEDFNRVMAEGGKIPLATVLRCRIRYFSDGAVLGSKGFVEQQLAAYRERTGRREGTGPRALPPIADWGELVVLRKVRQPALR
jgi:REP element-mobilizing transposase RayT